MMTVREVIEALLDYPQSMPVHVGNDKATQPVNGYGRSLDEQVVVLFVSSPEDYDY